MSNNDVPTMEYLSNLPEPVQQLNKGVDKDTTLWVTQSGEFLYLPTEEQAKKKAKTLMSKLKPEEWWAQKVSKFSVGQEDYLCAYIKRDFSKKHDRSDFSNVSMDEMWIGRTEIGLPLMATDTRQRTETPGERIAQVVQTQMPDGSVAFVPVLGKKGYYSYHKATNDMVAFYQKMCGLTMEGITTQFVYVLLNGGRNVGEDIPEEFWANTLKAALDMDRNVKRIARDKDLGRETKPKPGHLV